MAEKEYIEKIMAIETLRGKMNPINNDPYSVGSSDFINSRLSEAVMVLEDLPAEDVEQVRHGKWIYSKCEHYKCSRCHVSVGGITTPYCPRCGAKMDGGKADEHQ